MAKVGIQLYTVRDNLEKDYIGTIKKMKELGYEGVEFPGGTMEKISAVNLKKILAEVGLLLAGIAFEHLDYERDLEKITSYCQASNCKTVVYPWIPEDMRKSKDDYIGMAILMNEWGRKFKEQGIEFLYHIHGYEFEIYDGKTGFDIFMGNINTDYVKLEIDVYWVAFGGVNAEEFIEKYAYISPSIHFKDFVDIKNMEDTEVGEGCLNMKKIADEGIKSKANWFIVEQEQFNKPSMKSAEISANNLLLIRNIANRI